MISTDTAVKIINKLNGAKLQYICRTLDLIDIGIGDLLERINRKGERHYIAKYALHIQCPFRIIVSNSIVLGSDDLWISVDKQDSYADLSQKNSTIFDLKLENLNQIIHDKNIISANVNDFGDIVLYLEDIRIEIFTTGSTDSEQWRIFETNTEKEHFVRTGKAFEFQ